MFFFLFPLKKLSNTEIIHYFWRLFHAATEPPSQPVFVYAVYPFIHSLICFFLTYNLFWNFHCSYHKNGWNKKDWLIQFNITYNKKKSKNECLSKHVTWWKDINIFNICRYMHFAYNNFPSDSNFVSLYRYDAVEAKFDTEEVTVNKLGICFQKNSNWK